MLATVSITAAIVTTIVGASTIKKDITDKIEKRLEISIAKNDKIEKIDKRLFNIERSVEDIKIILDIMNADNPNYKKAYEIAKRRSN